jgi:hypothetical protein
MEMAMSGLIVPEKDVYDECLVLASLYVEIREEPIWFRKHYYSGELEQLTKYGLSAKVLAPLRSPSTSHTNNHQGESLAISNVG